jgi:hypothetical protein
MLILSVTGACRCDEITKTSITNNIIREVEITCALKFENCKFENCTFSVIAGKEK